MLVCYACGKIDLHLHPCSDPMKPNSVLHIPQVRSVHIQIHTEPYWIIDFFQVKGQVYTGQSEAKIMSINFMLISYQSSKTYFVDTHQDSSIMYPREDSKIR